MDDDFDVDMAILTEFIEYAIEKYESDTGNFIHHITLQHCKSDIEELDGKLLIGFDVERKAPVV